MNHGRENRTVRFHLPIAAMLALGLVWLLAGCGGTDTTPTPRATPIVREVIVTAIPTDTPAPSPTPPATATPNATPTPAATATPFITPPTNGETVNIPILMYHHLNPLGADASESLLTWTVDPAQFAVQLDYLQEHGYHTITLSQLANFFKNGSPLPTKPIVLTFDDAWIDGYTVAFPELSKRGMVGVFFVVSNYVNAGGELFMNWEQAQEMDRAGMEIAGHTVSHEDLTTVDGAELERQLTVSKARIEEKLGHPITALAYPYGAHDSRVVAAAGAAGYRTAVILCCGFKQSADEMLVLPRIRISYGDTLADLAERLPPEE